MSTIQPSHRTIALWPQPRGTTCGFVIRFAVTLLSFLSIDLLSAQDNPELPPSESATLYSDNEDRSFDEVAIAAKEMKIDLIEQFVKILAFKERIKRVDGFDDKVISVNALSEYRLRIQGIDQNVTTMVVTGESGQRYSLHIHVSGDARHLQAVLQRHFPNSAINCTKLMGGNVLLTGYVTDTQTITQIMDVARLYAPEIINHMRVGGPQEVQLKVKIMEVQRSKLRTFGMDLQALGESGVIAFTPSGIAPLTGLINPIGGAPSVTMNPSSSNLPSLTAGFNTSHFAFSAFLNVLKEEGLLKFHTTPMIITRSGEPASIKDGGEFPIPVPGGLGTVTIEFREFGVILETLPIVVGPTRVRQQVHVVVSDKDTANSITLLGTTVPGISKREVYSTVEMNFGETMVIGGLTNRRDQGTTLKTPFLGELPIIGAAFRNVVMNEAETELIILLTPEFGNSLRPDQVPPGGPGQSTTVPTDRELYGHGLIEVPKYGPDCGPDCNNNLSQGIRSECPPPSSVISTSRSYSSGPAINPANTPGAGGLITPAESNRPGTVPPSPNNSQTRRSSFRAPWTAKNQPSNSLKRKTSDDANNSDPVQPAGFQKSLKSQQTPGS